MNKFTPGPWVADGRDISPESDQEISICSVMPIDIGGEKGWYEGVETQANARLIAAAPDLLEALSEIINDGGKFVMTNETHRKARAAIARAKGEQK